MQEEHLSKNGSEEEEAHDPSHPPTEISDQPGDQHDDNPLDDDNEIAAPREQLANILSSEQRESWRSTQALACQLLLQSLHSANQSHGDLPPGIDAAIFDRISSQVLQNILASFNPAPEQPTQLPLEPKKVRDIRVLATIGENVYRALITFPGDLLLWELFGPKWQTRYALDFYVYAIISYAGDDLYRAIGSMLIFPLVTTLGGLNTIHFLLGLRQATSITWPDASSTNIPLAKLVEEYTLDLELEHWLKYLTASPFILVTLFLRATYETIRWIFPSIWLRLPAVSALTAGFCYHRMYNCQSTIAQSVAHWPRPVIREVRRFMVFILDLEASVRTRAVRLVCKFKTRGLGQYTYTPLDANNAEFRLLRLEPISDDNLVRCWLVNVPLREHRSKEAYEAISYRWGNEGRNFPIVIDGKRFLVTRTVFELLHALQTKDRGRCVWIDAICINQGHEHASADKPASVEDLDEKSNQVALMGTIYRNASRVIAWVGGTANGRGALSFINKTACRDPEAMDNFEYERITVELWPWTILTTWLRVIELFKQPYFRRMWMLQEVALGRKVVVKHGAEEADWDDISPLVNFMMGSDGEPFLHEPGFWTIWYNFPTTILGVKGAHVMSLVRNQVAGWNAEGNPRSKPVSQEWDQDRVPCLPLDTLLGLTTDLSASNIKDKIYAVLGLTQQETRQHINIEYDDTILPAGDLLRDSAKHILIGRHEPAERLGLAGWGFELSGLDFDDDHIWAASPWSFIVLWMRRVLWWKAAASLPSLPSWVPHWTLTRFQLPAIEPYGYSAGAHGTKLFEEIPGRPNCIRASLSIVDEIELLGKPLLTVVELAQRPTTFLNDICAFVLEAKSFAAQLHRDALAREEPISEDGLVEALYRTIFCDYATGSLPPMDTSVLVQHVSTCEALLAAKGYPRQAEGKAHEKLGFELGRSIGGKSFCVTKGGRFGIVPPRSRVGDSIVMAWGTPLPLVMRSALRHQELLLREPGKQTPIVGPLEGDEHVLMGGCYVHGVMLGELRPTEYPPEMVVLR